MWKRTIAAAALTALTFGTFGATAASATETPKPADLVGIVQQVGQHQGDNPASSVQQEAKKLLGKLNAVTLPANSPKQAQLDQARAQLSSLANQKQPTTLAGNPLCDVVNGVLNGAYHLLLSLGVPNGPDIGLPDFPNPCRGQ